MTSKELAEIFETDKKPALTATALAAELRQKDQLTRFVAETERWAAMGLDPHRVILAAPALLDALKHIETICSVANLPEGSPIWNIANIARAALAVIPDPFKDGSDGG